MTFEELQDEVRIRYPGTTSILTNTDSTDIHISYRPLDISVNVPYCEDIDIFCSNYAKLLLAKINYQIEYHKNSINSLEYFTNCLEATLSEKLKNKPYDGPGYFVGRADLKGSSDE